LLKKKDFLKKAARINPAYDNLIDNPYLIEPKFNLLKVEGESKIKLETERFKLESSFDERNQKYYHFKNI
jgi:hypothetical protein